MIETEVLVFGNEVVAAELDVMSTRAGSMRPIWPKILSALQEITEEHFETEGARTGFRWEPTDQKWMWEKFQEGYSLENMKQTEDLFQSLTQETSHSDFRFEDHYMSFGSDLPQFGYHQEPSPQAKHAYRPPVDLTQQDIDWIARAMMNYVVNNQQDFGSIGSNILLNYNARWDTKVSRWRDPSTGRFVKAPYNLS